jgi:Right handed beta helix region
VSGASGASRYPGVSGVSGVSGTPGARGGSRGLGSILGLPRGRRRALLRAGGAVGVVVALLAVLLAVGDHETLPATALPVESGQAWVASDQVGTLTLLDGIAGRAEANIRVSGFSPALLEAGQSAARGFALDRQTGTVTTIDDATLAASSVTESLTGNDDQAQIYPSTNTLYVVDGASDEVTAYDAGTLREDGVPQPFGPGGSPYSAVVDSSGRLWVLDGTDGTLSWFSARDHGARADPLPNGSTLTVADGVPVVVESVQQSAYLVGSGGVLGRRVRLGAAGQIGSVVTGSATAQELLVTASAGTRYQTCSFALGSCEAAIGLDAAGHDLGPAVADDGRVFVPDYTAGAVWVLDPSGAARGVREVRVFPGADQFELVGANGLVFYNDPESNVAGTVAADGTVNVILKYGTVAAPATASATAAASASPSAAASSSAGPPARPTGSPSPQSAPGVPRPSPGTPRPAPSGSKAPSPSPSPSPTNTVRIPCGATLTSSTTLTQDMHCNGNALIIGADDVTLDLGGHTVGGSGSGAGITLSGTGKPLAGAVVENGTVSGFSDGLLIDGPDGADAPQLSHLVFTGDGGGGSGSAAIEVGAATVNGMTLSSVQVDGGGRASFESTGLLGETLEIDDSSFEDAPFTLDEPADVDVQPDLNSDAFQNSAVTFEYVGLAKITDTQFTGSPFLDMCHEDGADQFEGDQFDDTGTGLEIEGMAEERVEGDWFENDTVGLYLKLREGDTDDVVSGDTFSHDGAAGILLDDTAADSASLTLSENILKDNGHDPAGTEDDGGNRVADGIHLYAPGGGVTVSGNTMSDDAAYGIWSVLAGTASGSGNVSTQDTDGCDPRALCTYP